MTSTGAQADDRLVDDTVGRWSEALLGGEGRVRDVVHAPAP